MFTRTKNKEMLLDAPNLLINRKINSAIFSLCKGNETAAHWQSTKKQHFFFFPKREFFFLLSCELHCGKTLSFNNTLKSPGFVANCTLIALGVFILALFQHEQNSVTMKKTKRFAFQSAALLHWLEAHIPPGALLQILFKHSSQTCSKLLGEISSISLIRLQTTAHITNSKRTAEN